MEFRILGPLEVWHDGRRVPLGRGRQRALLAILLLHANQVVSTDTLIDALWPEGPPASAPKALQGLISGLRRTLGDGLIATEGPGYTLRLEPDALDARRFERLLSANGDAPAELVAARLREALALWHGPPLQDFTYDDFAQAEIARLSELELHAVEARIDADLALGRHAAVVPELERLLAGHPLRERPRRQLMLALYRSDRQAEALDVYREGRTALVDGLGLEPGPELRRLEQQILEQDPELDAPPLVPLQESPSPDRRSRRPLVLALAAAVVVIAAIGALLLTRDSGSLTVVPNSLVEIDPGSNKVKRVFRVGRFPGPPAVVGKFVFVANAQDGTVSRVDPGSGEVKTVGGLALPLGIASADGRSIWVGSLRNSEVTALDAETLAITDRIRLGGTNAPNLAAGAGSLWVTDQLSSAFGEVVRIDAPTGRVQERIRLGVGPAGMTFGAGAAWVSNPREGSVSRIDAATNAVESVTVGSVPFGNPAVGFGAVWVPSSDRDAVWRVDTVTSDVDAIVEVGRQPFGAAVGFGSVWVINREEGTVSRIDPRTNKVAETIRVGFNPDGIAVSDEGVWVSVGEGTFPEL